MRCPRLNTFPLAEGSGRARGFVLIELLLVLVVIAVLVGGYFGGSKGGKPESGTYQMSMERSKSAACIANRASLRTNIEMFRINHPGVEITVENMQKAGMSVAACPEGGTYGFTADGNIICTKHPDKK